MKKRIFNVVAVIVSLAFFLVRGDARRKAASPQKFAVVYPTGNLGDMVCATPIFRAIKTMNPGAHVSVFGSPKNRELLEWNTDVDEYVDVTMPFRELVQYVRREHFDAGIVVNLDAANIAALFLGGVPAISAFVLTGEYVKFMSRPYKLISKFVYTTPYTPGAYVPLQNLSLLAPFGIESDDAQKYLSFSREAEQHIVDSLREKGITSGKIAAIAPGAGADYKRWSPERFAQVANYLHRKHAMEVVILGGPNDRAAVEETIQNLNPDVHYWSPGPQSLDDLKATIARATVLIGNDSGAVHIGEALGIDTITIAGPTDVGEHMREDEKHKVVQCSVPSIAYQSVVGNEDKIDFARAREQMELIRVESVEKAVEALFQ